jgi:hypothetical protein
MLCDAVEGKLSIISPKIYQDLNENVYNYPESNLLTSIKLGYSYRTPITNKSIPTSGNFIQKDNLVLHIHSKNEPIVLLHANLSHTNSLIFTNNISPYYRGKWVTASSLINEQDITLEIYTLTGQYIPLSNILVKSSLTNNNTLYIKIPYKVFIDLNIEYGSPLFMTLYLNQKVSNINDTVSWKSIITYDYRYNSDSDLDSLLTNINNEYNDLTDSIYINGYLYSSKSIALDIINNLHKNHEHYI